MARCHLHESITKAACSGSAEAQVLLDNCDWFIDAWHLCGHKRLSCLAKFNPADRPHGVRSNTQAAEQAWRYFNMHKHSLRYMHGPGFELHLLWVAKRRNELNLCLLWAC